MQKSFRGYFFTHTVHDILAHPVIYMYMVGQNVIMYSEQYSSRVQNCMSALVHGEALVNVVSPSGSC